MACGSMSISRCRDNIAASRNLFSRLMRATASWKSRSSVAGSSRSSSSSRVTQPVPMRRVISAASGGLHCSSQRRGVTPFVWFVNRSGHIAAKSASTCSRSSWLCSSATPLITWDPTTDRWAMRTWPCSSSTIAMRRTRFSSPPDHTWTTRWKRRSISRMISRWRGSRRCNRSIGQRSNASGRSVWFVYEQVRTVMSHASSHSSSSRSSSTRISSATVMAGCVSLSWIATLSGKASNRWCTRW